MIHTTIIENQMEKEIENEMESGIARGVTRIVKQLARTSDQHLELLHLIGRTAHFLHLVPWGLLGNASAHSALLWSATAAWCQRWSPATSFQAAAANLERKIPQR